MKLKNIFYFIFIISIITILILPAKTLAISSEDLEINSEVALLVERSTGTILYAKNAYEKRYMASTTKIMTAILTLENCKDLSETTVASYEAIFSIPSGYSTANIQVGETFTILQLLNVLLIPSANDAANILAEYIGGSIESFASMMNTRAIELRL